MSKRHEAIVALLSPSARIALLNAREDGFVSLTRFGTSAPAIRLELEEQGLLSGKNPYLTARGEVTRWYALERMLP